MAASITPDPFVPSGHYRVRSPNMRFERTLARGILQGVPSKGWHCASSNGETLRAQLEIDFAGAQPLSEIVAVASKSD